MRPQLQPWPIRVTHWANLVLLTVMAGSGLRILAAYPFLGAQGVVYGWYPLQGESPPGSMTLSSCQLPVTCYLCMTQLAADDSLLATEY